MPDLILFTVIIDCCVNYGQQNPNRVQCGSPKFVQMSNELGCPIFTPPMPSAVLMPSPA